MTSLAIVPANAHGDLDVVRRLAQDIWHRHYPGIISTAQIDYMLERGYSDATLRHFVGAPGAGLAIATEAEQPLGFAAWLRGDAPATTKLDKLYVLPERHGQGIGARLVQHVATCARADGAASLLLNVNKHNAKAIAAYRRMGFAIREAVEVDIGGGFLMDDYVMTKAL